MTKREREYMERLCERCRVLRFRVAEGDSKLNYTNEWLRELHALEWAIGKVEAQYA